MPYLSVGALFAVLAQKGFDQIGEAIQQKYPGGHYALAPGQWLIFSPGSTTQEISNALGITGSPTPVGSAIIIAFISYFGSADPQIWEWIAARMSTQRG
jgi:hypothetical protein